MRRPVLVAAVILTGLAGAAAQAADWVFVSSGGGSSTYLDMASVTADGPFRSAWLKDLYPAGTARGQDVNDHRWLRQVVSRKHFNCATQRIGTGTLIVYFYDSDEPWTRADDSVTDWQPVSAGTIGDIEMRVVCGMSGQ